MRLRIYLTDQAEKSYKNFMTFAHAHFPKSEILEAFRIFNNGANLDFGESDQDAIFENGYAHFRRGVLDKGESINTLDYDGHNGLFYAFLVECDDMVEFCIRQGIDLWSRDDKGQSVFDVFTSRRIYGRVEQLMQREPDLFKPQDIVKIRAILAGKDERYDPWLEPDL